MSSGHAGERDVEAVGDQERHRAQREASASHNDVPIFAERSVRLRRAFLTLCTVDLVGQLPRPKDIQMDQHLPMPALKESDHCHESNASSFVML